MIDAGSMIGTRFARRPCLKHYALAVAPARTELPRPAAASQAGLGERGGVTFGTAGRALGVCVQSGGVAMKWIRRFRWRFSAVAVVVLASFCFGFTAVALGAFYVSGSSGNDSNPGTLTAPFKTLTKAQSAMKGSSTIKTTYVTSGTYTLGANLIFTSSDNGETWLPASGLNTVTIDGAGTYYIAAKGMNGFSMYGFTFQHLVPDHTDGGGAAEDFFITGSNIKLRWNTFLNCTEGCIGSAGAVSSSLIDSNTFNGQSPGNTSGNYQFFAAVSAGASSSHTTISHNLCENLNGGCVHLDTAGGAGNEMSNMLVTLNIANGADASCYDCAAFYFYDPAGGSTGNVYSYNEVFNNENGGAGKGVSAFYEDEGTSNFTLTGNICSHCGDWALKLSCPVTGHDVASYNILDISTLTANSGGTAMNRNYECSGGGGNVFQNNIVYSSGSWPHYGFWWLSYNGTGRPTENANLYYSPTGKASNPSGVYDGGGAANVYDTNPFNANPNFTNPSANNYTIPSNSPAYSDIGWRTLPTNQGPLPYSP